MNRVCIIPLSQSEYSGMLEFQRHLVGLRNNNRIDDMIIFTEHFHVYTAGIHTPQDEVGPKGHEWLKVERGGEWTYHGPGQLVTYFITNLKDRGFNVKDLITRVGEAISLYLLDIGIKSELRLGKETGTWIGTRKICSYGFALREFTTFHGLALNVSTDLSMFSNIRPCGYDPEVMTSIKNETGLEPSLKDAALAVERNLVGALGYEDVTTTDLNTLRKSLVDQ